MVELYLRYFHKSTAKKVLTFVSTSLAVMKKGNGRYRTVGGGGTGEGGVAPVFLIFSRQKANG